MRLDVYMQELSYEVVSQQASYDSAQLLSNKLILTKLIVYIQSFSTYLKLISMKKLVK